MGASDQGAVCAGLQDAVVLLPTKKGHEELRQPTAGLSLPQRKLLTLVDGRRSLQQIAAIEPALRADRLTRDAARLLERGLVQVDQGDLPPITRPTTVAPRTAPPTTRPARTTRPPRTVPPAPRAAPPTRRRRAPIGAIAAAVLAAVGAAIAYTIWQSAPSVLAPVTQSSLGARPAGEARAPAEPAKRAPERAPAQLTVEAAVEKAAPASTVPGAARAPAAPPASSTTARTPPTDSPALPAARKAMAPPEPPPAAAPPAPLPVPAAAPNATSTNVTSPRAAAAGPVASSSTSAAAAPEAAPKVAPAMESGAATIGSTNTAVGSAAENTPAKTTPPKTPPPIAAAPAEVPAWAREFAPIAPDNDGARAPAGNTLAPIERVPPTFPRAAVRLGITQGSVRARAIIAANGSVERVEFPATEAGSRVFEPAARAALLTWTFPPGEPGRTYEVLFNFVTP